VVVSKDDPNLLPQSCFPREPAMAQLLTASSKD
jgi:hypothetical protein